MCYDIVTFWHFYHQKRNISKKGALVIAHINQWGQSQVFVNFTMSKLLDCIMLQKSAFFVKKSLMLPQCVVTQKLNFK